MTTTPFTPDFGEPAKRDDPERTPAMARVAAAMIAIGLLVFILAMMNGSFRGGWWPFLGSFGLLSLGGSIWFFQRYKGTHAGIKHNDTFFRSESSRGLVGWTLGVLFTGFYIAWYWWDAPLQPAVRLTDPISQLIRGSGSDKWFFYSFIYTLAVLVFGVRMFMKYRHTKYHLIRNTSVMFFQLIFAFLIPQFMRGLNQPEFYFSYFWPLQYKALFPGEVDALLTHPGGLGTFLVGWGLIISFIAVPVLTYYLGKRWYCSWVCGCGGLAETLGDPYRQLSDKSSKAWKIERWMIHSVLVAITLLTALLWINASREGQILGGFTPGYQKAYGFLIGSIFSGVIGVGFYPIMGSRVWCRFGCPQAAILGIFQRFFSRFRITTNGAQCMSCGNCSTYCEMGIDVRAYAQRGSNIVRASCVGCGVCAAVCPRGVLKLENGADHKGRFPGSDRPVRALLEALGLKERSRS